MAIGPLRTSDIKSRVLHLAQTSVYQIKLSPPDEVNRHLKRNGFDYQQDGEDIELLCSNAVLPGTSLNTHQVLGDYTGVMERMAYRRVYDSTVDFTFYVDHDYKVIEFFDGWFDFISAQGEGQYLSDQDAVKNAAAYRVNYPKSYKTNMYIVKFEKDVSNDRKVFEDDDTYQLTYILVNAFPTNIISTPISYEGSNVLRYTVSCAFDRYVLNKRQIEEIES